jgi:hypothetical protein
VKLPWDEKTDPVDEVCRLLTFGKLKVRLTGLYPKNWRRTNVANLSMAKAGIGAFAA